MNIAAVNLAALWRQALRQRRGNKKAAATDLRNVLVICGTPEPHATQAVERAAKQAAKQAAKWGRL